MKKKVILLFASALIASITLSGCSSDAAKKPESSPATTTENPKESPVVSEKPTEKIIIKATKWNSSAKLEDDIDNKLINNFNATNDQNIEVIFDVLPGDGYGTKLTTSFASNDGYDVFLSGEGDFYKWVGQGVNQPLDDYIAKDTSFKKDEFIKSIYDMGIINGKNYYFIKDYNPLTLYYNRTMYDEAKLSYPDENTTWDDIFNNAKALTKKADSGKYDAYGFNAGTWGYALLSYVQSNGTDILDPTGTIAEGYMNSPKTIEVLEKYFATTFEGDNKTSPTPANLDEFGGPESLLANNKLGMFISGFWSSDSLTENNANYGTAVMPKDKEGNRVAYICAAGYTMGKNTKNPEQAYLVMKALTDVSAQEARTNDNKGILPTVESMLKSKLESINERDLGVISSIDYGVQPIGMRSDMANPMAAEFDKAVQEIIQSQGNVKDILDKAAKAADALKK